MSFVRQIPQIVSVSVTPAPPRAQDVLRVEVVGEPGNRDLRPPDDPDPPWRVVPERMTEGVEDKIHEVVAYCRSQGKTWTEIGQAFGMSKQAAWERFSGEE